MIRRTIGFDRKIQLNWLDVAADWVLQGIPAPEIRMRLAQLLEGKVAGEGSHSARGKTITVLMHIWMPAAEHLMSLRVDGLEQIRNVPDQARLPIHWGMCLATYPFFRDIATATGRLLALQQTVTLSQVTRRITEDWGSRNTVVRAVQRVLRSLVDWGLLYDTEARGAFRAGPVQRVSNENGANVWLLEAAVLGADHPLGQLASFVCHPVFFPFALSITPRDLDGSARLELHRQGLDEDIVMLKQVRARNVRSTRQLQLLP